MIYMPKKEVAHLQDLLPTSASFQTSLVQDLQSGHQLPFQQGVTPTPKYLGDELRSSKILSDEAAVKVGQYHRIHNEKLLVILGENQHG